MMRYGLYALLGGIAGGLLASFINLIPLVSFANFCCIPTVIGALLGMVGYLELNSDGTLTDGESAIFGAISGMVSGMILSAVAVLIVVVLGFAGGLAALQGELPSELAAGGTITILVVLAVLVFIIVANMSLAALGCWALLNTVYTERKSSV